jgi:hypothetical protein
MAVTAVANVLALGVVGLWSIARVARAVGLR